MNLSDFPAIPERAEKNHDFTGKIRKAWKTDCSEHAESKRKPSEGHDFGETAKLIKRQCARAPAQLACETKQQRD